MVTHHFTDTTAISILLPMVRAGSVGKNTTIAGTLELSGTAHITVDNLKLDGNTLSATNLKRGFESIGKWGGKS